jgi:hypothetical protein
VYWIRRLHAVKFSLPGRKSAYTRIFFQEAKFLPVNSPGRALTRNASHASTNGGADRVEAGHVPGAIVIRDATQHGTGPASAYPRKRGGAPTSAIKG